MRQWQRLERADIEDLSGIRMSPAARSVLLAFYVLLLALGILLGSAVLPDHALRGGVTVSDGD